MNIAAQRGFALWDLLASICFTIAIPSALRPARMARVGVAGYTLAGLIGLIIGVTCVVLQYMAAYKVQKLAANIASETRKEWLFRMLYLAAVVWIFVSAVAADRLSSWLLRAIA
jgi:hypothetical protein